MGAGGEDREPGEPCTRVSPGDPGVALSKLPSAAPPFRLGLQPLPSPFPAAPAWTPALPPWVLLQPPSLGEEPSEPCGCLRLLHTLSSGVLWGSSSQARAGFGPK